MCKVLGIDTSNYTTSAALLDTNDLTVVHSKMPLPVRSGEKGLRQSDAVFHHVRQLPQVLGNLLADSIEKPCAVGVTVRPRDQQGSYMPCFLAGETVADSIALALGIAAEKTSHQMGHILAALYDCNALYLVKEKKSFIAFHVSGGTTDMLLCTPSGDITPNIEHIGGSLDLKAGQLIDRVGIMLGLDFPCGAQLETLAVQSTVDIHTAPVIRGLSCCLSGVENQCADLLKKGAPREYIAGFCIANVYAALRAMTSAAL